MHQIQKRLLALLSHLSKALAATAPIVLFSDWFGASRWIPGWRLEEEQTEAESWSIIYVFKTLIRKPLLNYIERSARQMNMYKPVLESEEQPPAHVQPAPRARRMCTYTVGTHPAMRWWGLFVSQMWLRGRTDSHRHAWKSWPFFMSACFIIFSKPFSLGFI